jgi:hypothetical protein
MRLRVSVRRLLVFIALFAVLCYWIERPRQVANQFVNALYAKDRIALGRLRALDARNDEMLEVLSNSSSFASAQPGGRRFVDFVKGEYPVLFVIDGAGNLPDFQGIAVASWFCIQFEYVVREPGLRTARPGKALPNKKD